LALQLTGGNWYAVVALQIALQALLRVVSFLIIYFGLFVLTWKSGVCNLSWT
jgi:hypothetical protein